ncbi:hypothetical protein ACFX2F_024964 [Malus domestica]|uniref:Uncharacterized protein n=1 Tax=Malus domestica TaxID=3750 RepID=A0A498HD81_MALDO|nr:hypothetical protein DVH24_027542 [Malus domestica]
MEEVVEENEVKPLTIEQLELYELQFEFESESDDSVSDVSPRQTAFGLLGRHEPMGLELGPAQARSLANTGLPPSGNQALFHSQSIEQLLPLELL